MTNWLWRFFDGLSPVPVRSGRIGKIDSLVVGYFALSLALFCALPVLLSLLVSLFCCDVTIFLFIPRGAAGIIFASGTFMFHIMNVKMAVTSIFILLYQILSFAHRQTH